MTINWWTGTSSIRIRKQTNFTFKKYQPWHIAWLHPTFNTTNLLIEFSGYKMQHLHAGLGKWATVCWSINSRTGTSPVRIWKHKQMLLFRNTSHMTPGLDPKFNTTILLVEFSEYQMQHLHAGLGKWWATVRPLIGELAQVPLESENLTNFTFKKYQQPYDTRVRP